MNNLIDLHTHTVLSTHAFSTLLENVKIAKEKNLKFYGISDHGPDLPGGQHIFAIYNNKVIPDYIDGVRVLKGVEINILDANGSLDLPADLLARLDYGIASFHTPLFKEKLSVDQVTNAYLNLCDNPFITILGHIDDERFKSNYDKVCQKCAESNTLIEINCSSLNPNGVRVNSRENYKDILKACSKYQTRVIINSDAHICFDVGNYEPALNLMKECNFDLNLVVNFNQDLIDEYILKK